MTLHITYSNQFEALVCALCEDLEAARSRGLAAVFTPAEIIVPNHSVSAYLKYAIAQRMGVSANLSFQYMQNYIATRVPRALERAGARAQATGQGPGQGTDQPLVAPLGAGPDTVVDAIGPDQHPAAHLSVIDKLQLHALLCTVLADHELLADDDLRPVKSYLEVNGNDPDTVDLRRYQLAAQLASLFADYSLSRPELVRAWDDRMILQETRAAGVELWQRRLFLALFGPFGALARLAERDGVEWILGPQLFERVLAKELALPRHLHVFGFSYMPYAHHRVLAKMARASTVHVYAINPCMEYWEDLQSGWEVRLAGRQWAKRGDSQNQLSFGDIEDTPPLRLWGRPGRENVRMLDELTDCDFQARFADPVGPAGLTMLSALQRDILFREPERTTPHPEVAADDDSIRVLGCPSVQRELEVVGNEIWRLIRQDESLRFNDIAVLVSRTDAELYQAHIPAVFGQLHDIPHHLVDIPLDSESRVIEAFHLLLELPFGRFTRPELLRLLTHPAVLARYPDVDAADWIHWSERLGIVHGADHDDHLDTYIDKDVFNWQQGIRRLALGAFMVGEKSGEKRAIEFGRSAYLPEELPADRLPSAARFALVVRSLISDARWCRSAEKPLSEWRIFFELLLSSYLAPVDDADERDLTRLRDALGKLSSADIDGQPVSYRLAREFVRGELDGLAASVGEYLADGVSVAPLLPMRAIPYRVVFMVGLGEGRFPASERESPLDLRAARRRRGDVGPRERDRYLFLETLLSARDRLYISYVSRNEQTGESLQPSSVVLELSHILERGYAPQGGAYERIAVQHPLRRYDPRYFPTLFAELAPDPEAEADAVERPMISVSPSAHRQANALALRRHLESKLREQGRDMPSFAELQRALKKDPRFAGLRQRLGLLEIERASPAEDETVTISLSMVRRFLESPLQAWAAGVLRLRESDLTDLVARRDEAFATPIAPMVGMLRQVFSAHLMGGDASLDALQREYREQAELAELTGNMPIGVFSSLEAEHHQAILERWHDHVHSVEQEQHERFRVYSFGRGEEHRDAGALLAPISLTLDIVDPSEHARTIKVELFGRTEPVGDGAIGSLVLSHHDQKSAGRLNVDRYLLRALIDHVAMSAAGILDDGEHRATVVTASDRTAHVELAPWSRDQALNYLGTLVRDLLTASHDYLLPCEAVFEYLKKQDINLFAAVERRKDAGRDMSCLYGPITELEQLHAPYDADEIIDRRFGPLVARIRDRA